MKEMEPKITGEILGKVVIKLCKSLGLNLEHCVSIGTDGAAVCSSLEHGAVRYVKENAALFCSHSNVSDLSNASMVIKYVNKIASFFQYAKRGEVLARN